MDTVITGPRTKTGTDTGKETGTKTGTENMAYVRTLLRQKQPGFSAALELAVLLAELELDRQSCGDHGR